MQFRYRNARGKVITLPDVASLLEAIRSGAITAGSQLSTGKEGKWRKAAEVAAYQEAVTALGNPLASSPEHGQEFPPRSRLRRVALTSVGLVLVAWMLYYGFAKPQTVAQAAMPAPPGLRATAWLRTYSFQFGDSIALEYRRLQDWLARQHFAARLHGPALKNARSLQSARAVSAGYRARLDSIESASRDLESRLLGRADSLESATPGLDGLSAGLHEELEGWSRDYAEYARIQRGVGAMMDSLPAFLLEKQKSFAVWEGSPAFLSRDDGARYAALRDQTIALAARERAWSGALLIKRPEWLAGLLEDERPYFGRVMVP